ncbi:RICIN domain-containing protein [Streptomyces sp. NPDC055051]
MTTINSRACGSHPELAGYSWTYRANADGSFRLVSRKSGLCLAQSSGIAATVAACDGAAGQSWKFDASTSAGRSIKNMSSGACLTSNPGGVVLFNCGGIYSTGQHWRNIGAL